MIYTVRQRLLYYEDFEVEAESEEEAINKVNSLEIEGLGIEFVDTLESVVIPPENL